MEGFIQTAVGALAALFGGFGGAWFIRWRDDKRADQERDVERIGRINVLITELAENATNLGLRMEAAQMNRIKIHDEAYREMQTFIARELKPATWELLVGAYGPLRSDNYLYTVFTPAPGIEGYVLDKGRARDLIDQMEAASAALREERGPWPRK